MSTSSNAAKPDQELQSLERLDELVSLLLDDAVDAESLAEIERLLAESDEAKRRFVDFATVHIGLTEFFNSPKEQPTPAIVDLSGALGDTPLPCPGSPQG